MNRIESILVKSVRVRIYLQHTVFRTEPRAYALLVLGHHFLIMCDVLFYCNYLIIAVRIARVKT